MLDGDISEKSLIDWLNFCRDICTQYLQANPPRLGGIGGNIVEIDESKFSRKTKYGRGLQRGLGVWIFGAIERVTCEVALWSVPDRTRATLQPLIEDCIVAGSIVHSDQAPMYHNLNDIGYIHYTVNHSENFKNPVDGTHTNTIEGYWGNAKSKMKAMHGVNASQINVHLDELMYRQNRLRQIVGVEHKFNAFLEDIREVYDCTTDPYYAARTGVPDITYRD